MQKLAEICIRRPVFAVMIIMALVVVGASSYANLGVDRFPSVDLPTVSVRTNLPGAGTEEVESVISQRIEEVVNTVDGIEQLRSVSAPGTSIIIATFSLSRDIDAAAQDVRDRVSTTVRDLPEDATPPVVQKFDNDSTPVLTVALAGERSLRELTELGDKVIKPQLERAGGVRNEGAGVGAPPQRHADRDARNPPPVGREHHRRHREREARASAGPGATARGRAARSHPRSVALHQGGAARD